MKTLFVGLLIGIVAVTVFIDSSFAAERVRGYYRDSDGDGYKETYVSPYYRTEKDNNPYNNYSTQGNTNPYTGEKGYVNPYNYNNDNNDYNYNSNYGKSHKKGW